jgi:hypothetical protein
MVDRRHPYEMGGKKKTKRVWDEEEKMVKDAHPMGIHTISLS